MKQIFVFSGRFQPFGPHHFAAYKQVAEIYGKDNVYIVTSNSINEQSPMSFLEKKAVIQKYGIAPNQIVCCKNVYSPKELLERFNPNQTSLIICCGEKDSNRINTENNGYYTPFVGQIYTKPYTKCGYLKILPNQKMNYAGMEVNGTLLRRILPDMNEQEFKDLIGWYDRDIHTMFQQKFTSAQMLEVYNSIPSLTQLLEGGAITKTQLQRIEQYADKLFKEFGIDIEFQNLYVGTHFYQRLNDPRNITPISSDDLRNLFKKTSQRYGDKLAQLNTGAEGVLRDMESDVNMPFIIKFDPKNKELDLIPKTIMRKRDFKSSTPFYSVENATKTKKFTNHIMHPFEDDELTLGELKNMLCGIMEFGVIGTLKMDGRNLKVTKRNNEILCSRNKTTVLNPMNESELQQKYSTNELQYKSFTTGFNIIKKYIQEHYSNFDFGEGRTFINLEIIDPTNKNVYNYPQPTISIHGLIEYDSLGNKVAERKFNFKPFTLEGWKVQTTTQILTRPLAESIRKDYVKRFNSLYNIMKPYGITEQSKVKNIPNAQWMYELELLVLEIGNEIIDSFTTPYSNFDKTNINNIKQELATISKKVQVLEDVDLVSKYNKNFKKYMDLGMRINPCEGLVFQGTNNKYYKLTGSFSPLNQMLGIFKYKR